MTTHTPSALELDRRAYRRGRERRSILVAVASTLVFAAVIWVTVFNTPGWASVQGAFFDPAVALQALPFPSVLVSGSNDPYCAQACARQFAQAWGSQWVDAGPAGHINTASGLGDWDAGHALLEQLMKDN